jgi:hypothetical protein
MGELRLSLAVQYVSDAMARRPLQPMPNGLSQRRAELVYANFYYKLLFQLALLALVVWAPLEETLKREVALNWISLLVVGADMVLGIQALKPKRYFAARVN